MSRKTATLVEVYKRVQKREEGPEMSVEEASRRLSNLGLAPAQVGAVLHLASSDAQDSAELAESLDISAPELYAGIWMMGLFTGIEWERERRRA